MDAYEHHPSVRKSKLKKKPPIKRLIDERENGTGELNGTSEEDNGTVSETTDKHANHSGDMTFDSGDSFNSGGLGGCPKNC